MFCDVYENEIIIPRLLAKKQGDKIMADGFKLSANSVYGKSNDKHSFLQDPIYTMKTTLNGQLMLTMLCEKLVLGIKSLTMLQVNTDGITVKIHKNDINLYYEICKEWEKYTKLSLEFVEYSKMIIRDVNNYIAVSTNGKIKCKGAFKTNEQLISDGEYHKNNSFNICRIALLNYFVYNIPIDKTLKEHRNIYDFCGRQKFTIDSYGEIHEFNKETLKVNKIKQQKITRYYVSLNGSAFYKVYVKDKSLEAINKNYLVTQFNNYIQYDNFNDYNINYLFYKNEIMKEINIIENKQIMLKFMYD